MTEGPVDLNADGFLSADEILHGTGGRLFYWGGPYGANVPTEITLNEFDPFVKVVPTYYGLGGLYLLESGRVLSGGIELSTVDQEFDATGALIDVTDPAAPPVARHVPSNLIDGLPQGHIVDMWRLFGNGVCYFLDDTGQLWEWSSGAPAVTLDGVDRVMPYAVGLSVRSHGEWFSKGLGPSGLSLLKDPPRFGNALTDDTAAPFDPTVWYDDPDMGDINPVKCAYSLHATSIDGRRVAGIFAGDEVAVFVREDGSVQSIGFPQGAASSLITGLDYFLVQEHIESIDTSVSPPIVHLGLNPYPYVLLESPFTLDWLGGTRIVDVSVGAIPSSPNVTYAQLGKYGQYGLYLTDDGRVIVVYQALNAADWAAAGLPQGGPISPVELHLPTGVTAASLCPGGSGVIGTDGRLYTFGAPDGSLINEDLLTLSQPDSPHPPGLLVQETFSGTVITGDPLQTFDFDIGGRPGATLAWTSHTDLNSNVSLAFPNWTGSHEVDFLDLDGNVIGSLQQHTDNLNTDVTVPDGVTTLDPYPIPDGTQTVVLRWNPLDRPDGEHLAWSDTLTVYAQPLQITEDELHGYYPPVVYVYDDYPHVAASGNPGDVYTISGGPWWEELTELHGYSKSRFLDVRFAYAGEAQTVYCISRSGLQAPINARGVPLFFFLSKTILNNTWGFVVGPV